jgi:hypothetical protein
MITFTCYLPRTTVKQLGSTIPTTTDHSQPRDRPRGATSINAVPSKRDALAAALGAVRAGSNVRRSGWFSFGGSTSLLRYAAQLMWERNSK